MRLDVQSRNVNAVRAHYVRASGRRCARLGVERCACLGVIRASRQPRGCYLSVLQCVCVLERAS